MIKSVALYYFSGTGNTKAVTHMLKDQFANRGINVEVFKLDDLVKKGDTLNIDKYDLVGIGYPIYGFGTPRIIKKFIKLLPNSDKQKVFLYKTAAASIPINYNASSSIIRKLTIKNYTVFYDRIIAMGSNWFVKYDEVLVKKLYDVSNEKIKHMCSEILNEEKRFYYPGSLLKIGTCIIKWFEGNIGARFFGKTLKVNKECNQCGLCVKNCPMQNITLKDDKLKFSWSCIWCMKCIYRCPKNAISSVGMNFCIIKDGYDLSKVIDKDNWEMTEKAQKMIEQNKEYFTDSSF